MIPFLFAALADTLTFLALPPGGGANPLIAAMPVTLAVGWKIVTAVGVVWIFQSGFPYRNVVLGLGTGLWAFGAFSNVLTIAMAVA